MNDDIKVARCKEDLKKSRIEILVNLLIRFIVDFLKRIRSFCTGRFL